jgi:glycosyltransferase involved in cell wall biosynthesis
MADRIEMSVQQQLHDAPGSLGLGLAHEWQGSKPTRKVRRVLVLTNAYPDAVRPYYGAFVHSDIEALRRAGLDVDVHVVRGYAGKRHYVRGALKVLALNPRRGGYDVVHAYYGLMGVIGRLQIRAPLVISFMGSDIQGDRDFLGTIPRWSAIQAKAYAAAASFADATITRTVRMEQLLPKRCRARNHVMPAGVDLERFTSVSREKARNMLGWSEDEPTVIFAGDPERSVKNFPLARAAYERLRERVPEARLRIASKLPFVDIPVWMAAADVLILTSQSEGSPNVVKEAMAAELPVVATPVGDVAERLRGVPGCYVCPSDAEALAAALAAAIAHGRTPVARETIAQLDVRRTVEGIIDVYECVVRLRRDRRWGRK